MSSDRFAVLIHPDPALRRWVMGSGVVMTLIGILLLATTAGLSLTAKLLLIPAWLAWCGRDFRRQRAGAGTVEAIRMTADGIVTVAGTGGRSIPAGVARGSLVLEHWAWLRLELPGVGRYGELLGRSRVGEADWHRFQLIFRAGAAGFGHRGPA